MNTNEQITKETNMSILTNETEVITPMDTERALEVLTNISPEVSHAVEHLIMEAIDCRGRSASLH